MAIENSMAGEKAVRDLYSELLIAWNRRDAYRYGEMFTPHANVIGFDGSQYNGRAEIEAEIGKIFANHQTCKMTGIVLETRSITPDVSVLRAAATMANEDASDVNPETSMAQTAVAVNRDGVWRLELFQVTPAKFPDRPELHDAQMRELRDLE